MDEKNYNSETYVNFGEQGTPENNRPDKKKKRNGKKIAAIIAAVVLVVAVGIGVSAHAQIANFIRKSFSDPVTYYQYVEKKNRDSREELLLHSYEKLRNSVNASSQTKNVSYKLELGQSVKTMLSMTGMDFSALENIGVTMTGKKEENVLTGQVTGLINGQNIISLNTYVDYANEEGYVQIPEISEKYIDFSSVLKEMDSDSEDELESVPFTLKDLKDMEKYFPETEKVRTLCNTYTDLFIDNMDSVEKGTSEIEASGIRANYTDLKVTCKGKKMYDLMIKMISALKEDATMKEIVENMEGDLYQKYTEGLSSALEDLKKEEAEVSDDDIEGVMHVYVDDSGDIVGRVVTWTAKEDESTPITVTWLEPQKGSEVGTEIFVSDNDTTYFKLSGKGTRKGNKLSGEYVLGSDLAKDEEDTEEVVNAEELLVLKVSELDEDSLEDGYLNGSITVGFKALASATSYELQIDSKEDAKSATQTLSVVCGGDKLVTLTASSTEGGDVPEIKKPGEDSEICDASDEKAMNAYMSEWNVEEFIAAIKEKCGVDLSTYLSLYEEYSSLDDDYDSDDYDYDDDDLELYDYDDDYDYDDEEQEDGGILGL